jgi:hypothetical protein
VSIGAEEQVFGLQVSVDDVERVEVVEGECDFCCVELGDRVREALSGTSVRSRGDRRQRILA